MKRACVIGWPIEQSRSPLIHGYWLRRYGIEGAYTKEAVAPDSVRGFLTSLDMRGLSGCNVTLPHKEVAFSVAADKDPSAIAVGAANTVWLENGRLCAANTDTYGFMTHLTRTAPQWAHRDAPVSILGAGGAARAIVYGFLEAGAGEVRVFNRSLGRAEDLARHFGPRVRACSWETRSELSKDAAVLVNTTTAGMNGQGGLGIDIAGFHRDVVVADIVYVPLETGLLGDARNYGLQTVDGLGMLLHQAVPGFDKWFGVTPEVTDELVARLRADIEGPGS